MAQSRWFTDDGKLIHHKQDDPTPVLGLNAQLRSAGKGVYGEKWLVGQVPTHVVEMWVKEAGLRFDDREAVRDLIKRKLLDSDNAAFRIQPGTW